MIHLKHSHFYLMLNNRNIAHIWEYEFYDIYYQASEWVKQNKLNVEIWHYSDYKNIHKKITTLIYKL